MSMLCDAMNHGCRPHLFKLKHINIKTFSSECEKNLMVSDSALTSGGKTRQGVERIKKQNTFFLP